MKSAFEIGKQHGDGLDPLLVGEVFQPFLANLVDRDTGDPFLLGLQVEFFQFIVG